MSKYKHSRIRAGGSRRATPGTTPSGQGCLAAWGCSWRCSAVGKAVLRAREKLTEQEYEQVKREAAGIAAEILKNPLTSSEYAVRICYCVQNEDGSVHAKEDTRFLTEAPRAPVFCSPSGALYKTAELRPLLQHSVLYSGARIGSGHERPNRDTHLDQVEQELLRALHVEGT